MGGKAGVKERAGVSVTRRPPRPSTRSRAFARATARIAAWRTHLADVGRRIGTAAQSWWDSPRARAARRRGGAWTKNTSAGAILLALGVVVTSLFVAVIDRAASLPNPGLVYLPLVALLAYHWGWRHATIAGLCELACVWLFFTGPVGLIKPIQPDAIAQFITLAAVTAFVLGIVHIARARRGEAEHEAARLAALNRVGSALSRELNEQRLLDLIARTARDLTGAQFAAFTLRPLNALGEPLVPSEGNLFHLAAIVGVTEQQEEMFKRAPLGGEGLLAPIFRHGVPVRIGDALAVVIGRGESAHAGLGASTSPTVNRQTARAAAQAFAAGHAPAQSLRSLGVPRGHPLVRSFLGAPLLDRTGQVRGGLLLGHGQPGRFSSDDEVLLVGLAAQAAVALENARLFQAERTHARELDTIFESIQDGIALVDEGGAVRRENGASRAIREALDGSMDGEAVQDVLTALATDPDRRAARESRHVTVAADGARRDFVVSHSPVTFEEASAGEGSPTTWARPTATAGAVVVWHDITEATRLLEEQRARADAEARRMLLQAIIDELPSGVYVVRGARARLVLANRAAEEVWGARWRVDRSMADFLAASGTRMFGVDGRPIPLEELATIRALRGRMDIRHHQEVIRRPSGEMLPVLLNAVPIDPAILGASDDEPPEGQRLAETAAVVVLQDVTALKEAEKVKDDFIGIAAHELRTPLAAVKGYAETLASQMAKGKGVPLEDWQIEAIDAIDQAASRLSELTDDLLDVTRLQAGRLELRIEPTDLVALVRRAVKRLQVTTQAHTLRLHAPQDFVVVCVDPRRTEQVVANLLNNAIKYMPQGGDVDVAVDEDAADRVAAVIVRDRGIGIPANQQAQVFGRFSRADNAAALGIKGTGLGLYLCRELVERQGGRIWFDSVENAGSTFHVELPLAPEDLGGDVTDVT